MKTFYRLLLSATIVALVFSGCEKEAEKGSVSGKTTGQSECKSFKTVNNGSVLADTLSCVDYSFHASEHLLVLKHINTGFNCCPGALNCTVSMSNDTITIREFEESAYCDCNCLFDMDIEITGLSAKKYYLKFIEPYCGEQKKLFFEIDLINKPDGSHCAFRDQYPWGIF